MTERIIVQALRLRTEPSLETFTPITVPCGTPVAELSLSSTGWVQLEARTEGQSVVGWCTRQLFDAVLYEPMPLFPKAECCMWKLVEYYTHKVGYQRGAKAPSLTAQPPVIDCSGWVAFLLDEAMGAQNTATSETIFESGVINPPAPWSDRLILEIEARTPVLLEGIDITPASLPRCATIGLSEGYFDWQKNNPRLRGINHIAQIVRRSSDDMPFVSDSYSVDPGGVRLMPLDDWLDYHSEAIQTGKAWAVDPFALADPFCRWVSNNRNRALS